MRLRNFLICSGCILVAILLLWVSSTRLDYINSVRKDMKLTMDEPLENAPPSLAFATVAMGAFRGLVVDILWIRADYLKEQGQFFDAKQLAEWITVLQPRFASVWDFHAWNMAYNISVAMPASQPQDRWRWVRNGYELLRDKGIPKNPKSISLYRSLAWIFQHKMGSISDDAHRYYKLQLANEMQPLLGDTSYEYFQALAQAPTKLSEILAKPEVAKFISDLKSADNSFANDKTLVDNYLSLQQRPSRFNEDAFSVADRYRGTKGLMAFDIFAKAYHLRSTWKLDPEFMMELNDHYGPVDPEDPNRHLALDWRNPEVHAIYWAAKGLEIASRNNFSIEELNTDRIIFHSLQNLYSRGKMIIYPPPPQQDIENLSAERIAVVDQDRVFLFPDLRMFAPYKKAMLTVVDKYNQGDINKGATSSLSISYRNMLKNAVLMFYQAGHKTYAQKIYAEVKQRYPDRKEFQNATMVEFVRKRFLEELADMGIHDAREIIIMMLSEAYFRYALRDDDEAFGREKMAREVYDQYQKEFSNENVDRIALPSFSILRYIGLMTFLDDSQRPEYIKQSLLRRINIERPELFEKLQEQHRMILEESKGQN